MNLLIPVDEEQNISNIKELKKWVVITLDNGDKIGEKNYISKDDIDEFIDFVVVENQNEDIEDFLDENIGVLIAPYKMDTDGIVEGFIFKELYELGS